MGAGFDVAEFCFHKEGETSSGLVNLIVMQITKRTRVFVAWILAVGVCFALTTGASAHVAAPSQTLSQRGVPGHSSSLLKVGDKIPAFRGTDQFGRERDFANLRGPNGLVMLFFRSADW